MAPLRDGWSSGRTAGGAASSLWARLAFPLITAALVLLLGAAVVGLTAP
ncbi:MAG TPA: hypothetical protein PKJ99_09790 [Thermoanaerobaculales bacterium]|nr:hypothetical protein [Thermoanaerobaculales bacterium]HQL29573.1 hypothetical protein [Thermoanaerobaculales bacterium]